jgi:hypothetical protein
MLNKEYKFYLAFENSNCRDYITEKFYVNGLGYEFNYFYSLGREVNLMKNFKF